MRKTKFIIGEYYHIFNRGVDKREVFCDEKDYERFLLTMKISVFDDIACMIRLRDLQKCNVPRAQLLEFFQELSSRKKLINVICYCMNPNHYHLIVQQKEPEGVKKFMHKLGTSYTNYFNKKNQRSGSLFQGRFKSVHIDSNEYLLYLSTYVNCNNFIHRYNKDIKSWPYASYLDYIGKRKGELCEKEIILDQFKGNFEDYKKFCRMNAEYLKDKKEFQELLIEEPSS